MELILTPYKPLKLIFAYYFPTKCWTIILPYAGLSTIPIPVYPNFSFNLFFLCPSDFIHALTAPSIVRLPAIFSPAELKSIWCFSSYQMENHMLETDEKNNFFNHFLSFSRVTSINFISILTVQLLPPLSHY